MPQSKRHQHAAAGCGSSASSSSSSGLPARQLHAQAVEQAPIKPAQASRNARGQVDLDDLTSNDLDYGCDEEGLASLRKRLKHAINSFNGAQTAQSVALPQAHSACSHALRASSNQTKVSTASTATGGQLAKDADHH